MVFDCGDQFYPSWVFPADGISIPYKYTSALAPIMAPNVWNSVKVRVYCRLLFYREQTQHCTRYSFTQAHGELKDFETPYVVKLFKFMELADPQDAFTFLHPNTDARIDNDRFV